MPDCQVELKDGTWDPASLAALIQDVDVVVDTTANETFSLLLNEVCMRATHPRATRVERDRCPFSCRMLGGAAIVARQDRLPQRSRSAHVVLVHAHTHRIRGHGMVRGVGHGTLQQASKLQRARISRGYFSALPDPSALERLDRARHVVMEHRVELRRELSEEIVALSRSLSGR